MRRKMMRKIILGVVLALILILVACIFKSFGSNETSSQAELNQSEHQVQIALTGSVEEKSDLLKSDKLTEEGLVAICMQEEELEVEENELRKLFEQAFKRVEVTSEHQVQVAELGSYLYNRALLQSPHLTGAGLVAVCQNCQWMDLDNEEVQHWFKDGFETASLTSSEVSEIIEIGNKLFTEILLQKKNLTGEELVSLCSNSGHLDLERNKVQRWFAEAFERTELSAEEQLQVLELDKEFFNEALLDSSNLTGEVLVEVCRYASSTDSKVRSWIEEAFGKLELTSKQQVEIAKLHKYSYCKLLALSDNLSAEAFVELCSPKSPLDRKSDENIELLKEAFKKVKLSEEQEARIGTIFIKQLEEHE